MQETSGFNIAENDTHDSEYHVIRLIHESRSGFCRILEVKHAGRLFIAKTLKQEYRESKAHLDLLKKEYDLLSSLYHPSIIQAFEIAELEDEGPTLILEYAHGVTLQSYLTSGTPSKEDALSILMQICSAMDYCHKRGIIHRDLKPTNIMIFPQGLVVKIIDFNLSHSPSYVAPPLSGGTEGFTAPEEFTSYPSSSPTSDIWSIGKLMEVLQPKGDRTWKQVSRKCISPLPENRPTSVAVIPDLLKQKSGALLKVAIIIIICIVAVGVISYILSLLPEKNNQTTFNNTIASPIDSITSLPINLPPTSDSINLSVLSLTSEETFSQNNTPTKPLATQADGHIDLDSLKIDDIVTVIKSKAENAAASRFKEQLAILDTATHRHTFALARAGNWQWKAKQDMEKEINKTTLSYSDKLSLKALATQVIKDYGVTHHSELNKAFEKAVMERHVLSAFGVRTRDEKYLGNGQYLIKELDEDGEIKTHIEERDIKY